MHEAYPHRPPQPPEQKQGSGRTPKDGVVVQGREQSRRCKPGEGAQPVGEHAQHRSYAE